MQTLMTVIALNLKRMLKLLTDTSFRVGSDSERLILGGIASDGEKSAAGRLTHR